MGGFIGVGFSVGGRIYDGQRKEFRDSITRSWITSPKQEYREIASDRYEEIHLHIRCGENASSSMMFSFKPVGIYLPVDVNNVAFLQHELPGERIKENETHQKKMRLN